MEGRVRIEWNGGRALSGKEWGALIGREVRSSLRRAPKRSLTSRSMVVRMMANSKVFSTSFCRVMRGLAARLLADGGKFLIRERRLSGERTSGTVLVGDFDAAGDHGSAPLRESLETGLACASMLNVISTEQLLASRRAACDECELLSRGRYSLEDGLTSISGQKGSSTPEGSGKLFFSGVLEKNVDALSSDSSIISRVEDPPGTHDRRTEGPTALSHSSICGEDISMSFFVLLS